ncbi:hypothetical protein HPP92_018607 [Vanilla planifolia]|uniref:Uncharacterized protein n=1 Tax=Vanilla planifolia TaxID=51239 RepID=A0A835QBE9_VANPL|nr:hypothetical protein HPP92_018607 [Vanilla planifolia]
MGYRSQLLSIRPSETRIFIIGDNKRKSSKYTKGASKTSKHNILLVNEFKFSLLKISQLFYNDFQVICYSLCCNTTKDDETFLTQKQIQDESMQDEVEEALFLLDTFYS